MDRLSNKTNISSIDISEENNKDITPRVFNSTVKKTDDTEQEIKYLSGHSKSMNEYLTFNSRLNKQIEINERVVTHSNSSEGLNSSGILQPCKKEGAQAEGGSSKPVETCKNLFHDNFDFDLDTEIEFDLSSMSKKNSFRTQFYGGCCYAERNISEEKEEM